MIMKWNEYDRSKFLKNSTSFMGRIRRIGTPISVLYKIPSNSKLLGDLYWIIIDYLRFLDKIRM